MIGSGEAALIHGVPPRELELDAVHGGRQMDFDDLARKVFMALKPRLEESEALGVFARERAKFEGWLKVELCGILLNFSKDVVPERQRVDVTFDDWGIQLKTLNTNIRYQSAKNKHRPITKNVNGVIEDIVKLGESRFANRAVLFVVFPVTHDNPKWQVQLGRISSQLRQVEYSSFQFRGGTSGVAYFGLV